MAGAGAFAKSQADQSRGELRVSQYAVVEMMGYKRLVGRLSQGIAGLLQLDVPVEGGFVTQMINPQSIYRLTFVDESTVRAMAKNLDPLPTIELDVPPRQSYLDYDQQQPF